MNLMPELYYAKTHEWVRIEGNKAYIGITDYAQDQLGDIVYIETPELDDHLSAGDVLGVVESVKSASDIYAPLDGKVIEINEDVLDNPEAVNQNPYESWMVALEISDHSQLKNLLDASNYQALYSK